MSWYEGNKVDAPSVFGPKRTEENLVLLNRLLGSTFLSTVKKLASVNALAQAWSNTGIGSFLEINWLAEDLRLLEHKAGIGPCIRDLLDSRLCLPTWHMLHTAAIFERARGGAVLEFIDAGHDESPDFVIDLAGKRVAVEAKLLTQSEDEERFEAVATRIEVLLEKPVQRIPKQTAMLLVIKKPVMSDISSEVFSVCEAALRNYSGVSRWARGPLCNVLLEPIAEVAGIADVRTHYILAPVPESENIRVVKRAKKASSQLRSFPTAEDSGIVAIGLSDNQESNAVFEHITKRIRKGRFSGIAGVLLIKRRTLTAPPRATTIDLLELRKNPRATFPIDADIPMHAFDAAALLSTADSPIGGIRAYRFGSTTGRVTDPASASLFLPDIRLLTHSMMN